MVAFLLRETRRQQDKLSRRFSFSPNEDPEIWWDGSYYRRVRDLYLAAMLYYINKFGSEDIDNVERRLFVWVFNLRDELFTVTDATIDGVGAAGRGSPAGVGPSPFVLIRNASSGRALSALNLQGNPTVHDPDNELHALLKELGG